MIPIDLKDRKFSRLTVIEYDKNSAKTGHAYWLCRCVCGKYKYVRSNHLTSGNVRSCGCLAREIASVLLKKYANSSAHKGSGNPQWKKEGAKHAAIHTWLNRHYKKKTCEVCGTTKRLDWALKNKYLHGHERKRYRVLCRSHHMKYDYKYKVRISYGSRKRCNETDRRCREST